MIASIVLAAASTLIASVAPAVSGARAGLRVISPVRVFSGEPGEPVRADMAVLIQGERIVLVAPLARMVVPAGAERIDGGGGTLLPGLIDLHVHLSGSGSRFDRPVPGAMHQSPAQALACGVTTLLDLNAPNKFIDGLTGVLGAGDPMPWIHTSLEAVTCPGGHGTEGGFPARILSMDSEAAGIVDALAADGADFIKVMYDGGGWAGHAPRPMLSETALQAIVLAARERDLRVIVHAVTVDAMHSALAAGASAIAHAPVVGEVDDALIRAFLENDAALISTLAAYEAPFQATGPAYLEDPLAKRFVPAAVIEGFRDPDFEASLRSDPAKSLKARFPSILDSMSRLHAAGVRILLGTDAGTPGTWHGVALHRELELLVRVGMTPAEALVAATSSAANFLEREDIGVVEVGRRADLVLVAGRPDEQIRMSRSIQWVMLGGQIVDRDRIEKQTQAIESGALRSSNPQALIDFEAPDDAFGSVSTSNRESSAFASRMADRMPGNAGSYVRLSGEIVPTPPSGGFARLELPVSPPSGRISGVFFRARATPRARYRVQLGTRVVLDGDDFGVEFAVDETWKEYRLPFDAFAQVGFGKRVRFRPGEILTISWMTGVGAKGDFQLDVDDLGWFR